MLDGIRRWFGNGPAEPGGSPPDYRFSLANERTFLAWIRTGLALVGGGLAVASFLRSQVPHLREVLAVGLMVLGAVVAIRAVDHWARCERAMWHGQPLPASRFPGVLAVLVGLGAILLAITSLR